MSPAIVLWLRPILELTAAGVLLAVARPKQPPAHMPLGPGLALAIAVGCALVLVLAGRLPPRPHLPRQRVPRVALKAGVLGASALAEEIVWRLFAIGLLAGRLGNALALVLATVAFALAHSGQAARAVRVHLATGGSFGAVYLATGSVAAAALAHATYNLTILLALQPQGRARSPGEQPT